MSENIPVLADWLAQVRTPRWPMEKTTAMSIVITIAAAILSMAILWAIGTVILRLTLSRRSRRKTRSELERLILRYEQDYFDYLGQEHPDVVAFKVLVETKDIQGIREHWSRLSNSFLRLEAKAGWRGRPLIMDYYYSYEETLAALAKHGT